MTIQKISVKHLLCTLILALCFLPAIALSTPANSEASAILPVQPTSSAGSMGTSVYLANNFKCTDIPCNIVYSSLSNLSNALNKNVDHKKLIKLIRTQILINFDFMMIVKYSLGEYNNTIPEQQKQEIAKLFKEMLINTYTLQLYKFNHTQIKIVSSNIDDINPNQANVICHVKLKNQTRPIVVEYLLTKTKAGWKIYDVTVDDISVLSSFKMVFDNVISSEGVDGLIMLLKSDEISGQINEVINNQNIAGK